MAGSGPIEKLQQLESIEKDISSALLSAGKALEELSKEKTVNKTVETQTTNFIKTLDSVKGGLMKQINYLTQFSTDYFVRSRYTSLCAMFNSGIDMERFSSHCIRGASADVPIQEIMKVAGLSSEQTFVKYYNKPVETHSYDSSVLKIQMFMKWRQGHPHEGSCYAAQKDLLMAYHRKAHVVSRLEELEKLQPEQKPKTLQLTKNYSLPPMARPGVEN